MLNNSDLCEFYPRFTKLFQAVLNNIREMKSSALWKRAPSASISCSAHSESRPSRRPRLPRPTVYASMGMHCRQIISKRASSLAAKLATPTSAGSNGVSVFIGPSIDSVIFTILSLLPPFTYNTKRMHFSLHYLFHFMLTRRLFLIRTILTS